ncbi:MAG: alpha/beta fold hydrolase [Pseudomonadota bacterium]
MLETKHSVLGPTVLAAAMAACTVSLTPEDILVGDEDFRRTDFTVLDIQDEDSLPSGTELLHEWLDSDIGPLALTWAHQSGSRKADRLIVYCMGNMTDRQSDGADYLAGVVPFGDAIIFDYPGYGDSAGPVSLDNFDIALGAVAERVAAEPYEEIVLWGHSMGGILCPRLASRLQREADHIVFEATFSGVDAVTRYALPWYMKPFIRLKIDERFLAYNSVAELDGFGGSVTVLAAVKDKDLRITAVRDLAEKLETAGHDVQYAEFEDAGHYDIAEQPDYVARVSAALDWR